MVDVNDLFYHWCEQGNTEGVSSLLSHYWELINLNHSPREKEGQTSLSIATANNHVTIVQLLLSLDEEFRNQERQNRMKLQKTGEITPAPAASSSLASLLTTDQTAIFNCEMSNKKNREALNVNCQAFDGSTPLCVAAERGHHEIVKLLLKHAKIKANMPARYGTTALFNACFENHVIVVQQLLEFPGINLNNSEGEAFSSSPLFISVKLNRVKIVEMLLRHPSGVINVNEFDRQSGMTPLMAACQDGHLEIVRMLLGHPKIDPNKAEKKLGKTPLILACENGHRSVVQLLLKVKKLKVNQEDRLGCTALYHAAQSDYPEVLKVLKTKKEKENLNFEFTLLID